VLVSAVSLNKRLGYTYTSLSSLVSHKIMHGNKK
jgi:hypothetical protein